MAIQAQTIGNTHRQDLTLMDNSCGFNNNVCDFVPNDQELQKQNTMKTMMMQQSQQFQNLSHYKSHHQNLLFDNSVINRNGMNDHHPQYMDLLPQTVSTQIEKQRIELDRFVILQNERLRLALQEQRKQQLTLLLKKYEASARVLIARKDEEISKEVKRTTELQEFLRRMEIEGQTWQRLAKENEVMVQSLNNAIERLRENNNAACLSENAIGDAGSCCIGDDDHGEDTRRILNHHKMVCRCCNNKTSCVIILPCRHLCSCRDCEALLESCPVCKVLKKGSIEALF